MSPADLDLARELVAHPRWEWLAGMLVVDHVVVCRISYHTPGYWHGAYAYTDKPKVDGWLRIRDDSMHGYVPDLDDPATAGVLLGMLAESVEVVSVGFEDGVWFAGDGHYTHVRVHECGPTPGAALARALLAAWGPG